MTDLALVFRVGARVLAIDAAEVAAVARRPALTRVPRAPRALAGVGALKGRTTPVVELAQALGEGEGEGGGAQLVVLQGADPVALAVDRVEGLRARDGLAAERLDVRRVIAQVLQPRAAGGRRLDRAVSAPANAAPAQELGFLAFSLAGQRFAFPLAEVRAVLPAPAELAFAPDADPVVLGLTPYDEGVLPVLELADLLGLPRPTRQARLIVAEIGGAAVGLRVERVLGALRLSSHALSPVPAVLNRGGGEARLTAIARTPSGLTAILAVDRLFDEATVQRLQGLAKASPTLAPKAADVDEPFVVFRLGEERCGLPAAAVEAVAKAPAKLLAPPNAPPFLTGVTSHRGEVFPLVDLRTRFDAPLPSSAGAVILLRSGEIAAGLLVTAVERLARVSSRDLERAPPLAGDAGALFTRTAVVELEGRPLLVADPDSLLGQARRDLVLWSARARDGCA